MGAAGMLGPDSRLLTALLIIVSVALLVAVVRFRLLPVKILCGALSIMVAMVGGVAAVTCNSLDKLRASAGSGLSPSRFVFEP